MPRTISPVSAADPADSRNSAVSRPSRLTAAKATSPRPREDPATSASVALASSSPFSARAWVRIQKIIQVSSPAAARHTAAKVRSRTTPSRPSTVTWRTTATAVAITRAAPVPSQTARVCSGA